MLGLGAQPPPSIANKITAAESRDQLATWLRIRNAFIAIGLFGAGILYLTGHSLPAGAAFSIAILLGLINLASHLRLSNQLAVLPLELCIHYLLDISLISLALFFCGAANNPFVSLLFIPVSLAAAALNRHYCAVIGGWALISYSLLFIGNDKAPATSLFSSHHSHLVGMWCSFAVCTALLLGFINSLARQSRQQAQDLQALQTQHHANAKIFNLALQRANISHNLATPLNNIQLLSEELREQRLAPQAQRDLDTLQSQLQLCRQYLRELSQPDHNSDNTTQSLSIILKKLHSDALLLHPDIAFSINLPDCNTSVPTLVSDALQNILQNAINAGATCVQLSARVVSSGLEILLSDNGRGLNDYQLKALGKIPLTSDSGLGIGIYLTQQRLASIQATLYYQRRHPQGTQVTISIPLTTPTV